MHATFPLTVSLGASLITYTYNPSSHYESLACHSASNIPILPCILPTTQSDDGRRSDLSSLDLKCNYILYDFIDILFQIAKVRERENCSKCAFSCQVSVDVIMFPTPIAHLFLMHWSRLSRILWSRATAGNGVTRGQRHPTLH